MKNFKLFLTLSLITILAVPAWGADESVTFKNVYSADDNPTTYNGTDFSVTFNKGTNSNEPVYKTTGDAVRIYGGGYFIVSSTTKTITKIELTFGSGDGSNTISTNVNTYNNSSSTWTGSATSVKFSIGGTSGHRRLAKIAVTFSGGATEKVATPTFTPAAGSYSSAQSVTISCTTSGATIHYTTDGSTPTASSPTYSSAITVSSTKTIKAIAVKSGMTNSDVASATYTITGGGGGGSCDIFSETWDGCSSTGGNDNKWSGGIASGSVVGDNTWTYGTAKYGANHCVRLGSGSAAGTATTPSITVTPGTTYMLSFKAGAWSGDSKNLTLSATGATLGKTGFTMGNAAWADLSTTVTATSASMKITFTGEGRFFLDDVCISSIGGGGTYKISYDKNHAEASGSMSATNADGDGKATVAENAFSAPDGMAFASWNTEADGSGDTYNKDDVITLTADLTLYAQWVKSEVEIVEWFPDSIRIVVPDATDASVIIENKDENTSSTTKFATNIFFSKYFEAEGTAKMLAIYNGTDHEISLSNVSILQRATPSYSPLSLASYGQKTGFIQPGEEIILFNEDTRDDVMKCARSEPSYSTWNLVNNNNLAFSGKGTVRLFQGGKCIDIIGAMESSAVDGDVHNTSKLPMAGNVQPDFGDDYGFTVTNGDNYLTEAEETNYVLSTNRCLLIRKNHVLSGDSAVLENRGEFKTLGPYTGVDSKTHKGEWAGLQIPTHKTGGTNDFKYTCEGFQQVGKFDYNNYFSQYEPITEKIVLDGQARDDGTYNIPIPALDDLACTMLKVKVFEGSSTEASTAREYKVPIMVQNGTTVTTDEIFSNIKTDDYAGSKDICKDCDVVILKGATLTKTTGTKDVDQIRDLMIYPGGKLAMPAAGGTYKVNSIQFRVEGDTTAPFAELDGALEVETQELRVSRRIRNKRYYFFSLPYACNVADIRWSNGDIPVKGTEYEIKKYDGYTRATTGNLKSWTTVPNTGVLEPGVGYNIAVASETMRELVFPMALGQKDLSDKETDKADATVEVRSYTGSTTIENHNWNLIAHPYVARFAPYTGNDIKGGILVWNDYNDWERHDESNVYLTIPNYTKEGPLSANDYTQVLASTMTTSMDPFVAVFVQGKGNPGSVVFSEGSRRASAPGRHLAAKSEYADESIFVGVTLSGNGGKDQTNLRIRPDFNEEYQLGYDLTKFGTTSEERPVLYMRNGGYNLAFRAINDNNAAMSQPMGVYCKAAGTYTFALSNDYSRDNIEAVYLYDAETQQTINLMNDTYEFTTTGNLNTRERFYLSAVVRRPAPQVTTDNELVNEELPLTRKIILNGHVFIQHGGKLFDITGKEMLNH